MKKLSLLEKQFMLSPLNEVIFNKIFELKADAIGPILNVYKETQENLKKVLWEEFDTAGMEVRIANTAFDWLIGRCEGADDLCATLKGEVRNVILHAAIFYTNVAPNAITDRGWKPENGN